MNYQLCNVIVSTVNRIWEATINEFIGNGGNTCMYTRKNSIKYWDFMIIGLMMLEIAFLVVGLIRNQFLIFANNQHITLYLGIIILALYFSMVPIFNKSYENRYMKGNLEKVMSIDKHVLMVSVMSVVSFTMIH